MPYTVVTDAASEPISLAEAKLHLKVDYTADNDLIDILRKSARQVIEAYTDLSLLQRTIDETFDEFPDVTDANPQGAIYLTVSPLSSVTSITYKDDDGASQTWSSANYVADTTSKPPRIAPVSTQTWPSTEDEIDAVTVRYVAGYASTTAMPAPLRTALLLTIGHWYTNRADSVRRLPTQVEWILNKYRIQVHPEHK